MLGDMARFNYATRTSRRPPEMPPRFIIYCQTNRITGKRYIGQTKFTLRSRWKEHVQYARAGQVGCRYFFAAIRKYGPDAFDHEVLDIVRTQAAADLADRL